VRAECPVAGTATTPTTTTTSTTHANEKNENTTLSSSSLHKALRIVTAVLPEFLRKNSKLNGKKI